MQIPVSDTLEFLKLPELLHFQIFSCGPVEQGFKSHECINFIEE